MGLVTGELSATDERRALAARMCDRRPEIELAIRTRADAIADPAIFDASYLEGLRSAIGSGLDYALIAIESGGWRAPPIPDAVLAQTRAAARNDVELDVILRRCFAGYTLLADFLGQEAEQVPPTELLRDTMQVLGVAFNRLVNAVTDEYRRESRERLRSKEAHRRKLIRHLLAGELVDAARLGYEFSGWHVGVLASGREAEGLIRELATLLGRTLLMVRDGDGPLWAWLGGRTSLNLSTDEYRRAVEWAPSVKVAFGEPGRGLAGWRLTHRQANATWPIAQRDSDSVVRYSDVALWASVMRDDVLMASLRQLYVEPLMAERDGGETLHKTLLAYFAADRNVSSAAAALGVSRRTVANRLQVVEDRVGRPLAAVLTELDVAVRLRELDGLA